MITSLQGICDTSDEDELGQEEGAKVEHQGRSRQAPPQLLCLRSRRYEGHFRKPRALLFLYHDGSDIERTGRESYVVVVRWEDAGHKAERHVMTCND